MRNAVRLITLFVVVAAVSACNGKQADQPAKKAEGGQMVASAPRETGADRELAAAFLAGLKSGDKTKMYQAANLTPELVNSSRDELIHIKQNKMGDARRVECEHVLKISGDVDFFAGKLRKLFPESATVRIVESKEVTTASVQQLVHTVSVTYASQADAVQDKSGKPVKELRLALQQFDYPLQAGKVHEFSFTSQDYEKIASRDFEVAAYF